MQNPLTHYMRRFQLGAPECLPAWWVGHASESSRQGAGWSAKLLYETRLALPYLLVALFGHLRHLLQLC